MKPPRLASSLTFSLIVLAACSQGEETRTPPTLQVTPPANMRVVEGKLLNQITRIEKDMPRAGSQGFVVPTDEQKLIFTTLATDLRTGHLEKAMSAATATADGVR